MAGFFKFFTPLACGLIGLALWITSPSWQTGIAAAALFLVGSSIGNRLFANFATPEEIQADLEHRKRFGGA